MIDLQNSIGQGEGGEWSPKGCALAILSTSWRWGGGGGDHLILLHHQGGGDQGGGTHHSAAVQTRIWGSSKIRIWCKCLKSCLAQPIEMFTDRATLICHSLILLSNKKLVSVHFSKAQVDYIDNWVTSKTFGTWLHFVPPLLLILHPIAGSRMYFRRPMKSLHCLLL